jgi:hypothetical protein
MNEAKIMRDYAGEPLTRLQARRSELAQQERPLSKGQRVYRNRLNRVLETKGVLHEHQNGARGEPEVQNSVQISDAEKKWSPVIIDYDGRLADE